MQECVSIYETCECDIGASDIHRFLQVDELSTGPPGWGVIVWYQSLGTGILRTRWGTCLGHAFIVHFDELICVMCA